MARTRAQWKTVQPFRPTIGSIRRPPQHLRRRVMELNGTCDPAEDRRRAVFTQELYRQLGDIVFSSLKKMTCWKSS